MAEETVDETEQTENETAVVEEQVAETRDNEETVLGDNDSGEEVSVEKKEAVGVQKRINELTWEKHQARKEAERLKVENEELRKKVVVSEKAINIDDYETQELYISALVDRKAAEITSKVDSRLSSDVESRAQIERNVQADQIFSAGKNDYADFEAVIKDIAEKAPLSPVAAEALLLFKGDAHHVIYHLAKNPDLAVEIAGMSSAAQILRMTEIRQNLSSARKTRGTGAPPVITKAGAGTGGGGRVSAKDLDKMSMAEYTAYRKKQDPSLRL